MQTTRQATREGSRHRSMAGNGHNTARHTEPAAPPNTLSHRTIRRFLVTDGDTGNGGAVAAARCSKWIDEAAHVVAAQWSGRRCVVACVGNVHLDRPISVGELVELHAGLVYTGRSSMHILVTVHSRDPNGAVGSNRAMRNRFRRGRPQRVTPSRYLGGHRSPCSNYNDTARPGSGYGCASASKAPWPRKATPRRAPHPHHARFLAASTDADGTGQVHGGRIMRWIDERPAPAGAN